MLNFKKSFFFRKLDSLVSESIFYLNLIIFEMLVSLLFLSFGL